MAADASLLHRLDRLIALFNARSLDLPDGLFSRTTQFVLNGVPFEERLGRPPGDPLVRMLARGPAGYRFATKAVQHAVPDGVLQRGEVESAFEPPGQRVRGRAWLSGHYRGSGESADILFDLELTLADGRVECAAVEVEPATLALVHQARLRP